MPAGGESHAAIRQKPTPAGAGAGGSVASAGRHECGGEGGTYFFGAMTNPNALTAPVAGAAYKCHSKK